MKRRVINILDLFAGGGGASTGIGDAIVEIGYEYEETTTEVTQVPYTKKDGTQGTRENKHVKKVTKMVLPDTTAQIFWLKNRKSAVWRDRQDQIINSIEDLTPLAELLND